MLQQSQTKSHITSQSKLKRKIFLTFSIFSFKQETAKAFLLALLIHSVLLIALIYNFQWRLSNESGVQAEIWSDLPDWATHSVSPVNNQMPIENASSHSDEYVSSDSLLDHNDQAEIVLQKHQKEQAQLKLKEFEQLKHLQQLQLQKEKQALQKAEALRLQQDKEAQLLKQRQQQAAVLLAEQKKQEQLRKLENEKKEKLALDKLAAEKKQAADRLKQREKEQREKEQKEKQQRDRQQAIRDQKLEAERQERLAARRQMASQNMSRLNSDSAGSGAYGQGAGAIGTSSNYASKVRKRILPHVIYDGETAANPLVIVEIKAASDGRLISRRIVKASGNPIWDQAVLRAIDASNPLPVDDTGYAPAVFIVRMRPLD